MISGKMFTFPLNAVLCALEKYVFFVNIIIRARINSCAYIADIRARIGPSSER